MQLATNQVNITYNFVAYDPNYLWYDYTFNVTQLISGVLADSSRDCSYAGFQALNVTVTKFYQFNSTTDYILAFLQNMLGNVVSF